MRTRTVAGPRLVPALALTLSQASPAAPADGTAADIKHVHKLLQDALDRNDVRAVASQLHASYLSTNSDGTTSGKAAILELLRSLRESAHGESPPPADPSEGRLVNRISPSESTVERDVDVRVFGDSAVITGLMERMINGKPMFRFRFTEMWVREGGRWVAVSSHSSAPGNTPCVVEAE